MFTIITPYVFDEEIAEFKNKLPWGVPALLEKDTNKIGPDLMYQKLWNSCDTDIFIMHADMAPHEDAEDWDEKLLEYVEKYPEAGILGLKLIYPGSHNNKQVIECAGGKFTDNKPDHYGSGLELFSGHKWKELEYDEGQYDKVREVAWYTFGGIYIRRELLNREGDFDPRYLWSYNRDVDYCLEARKAGWRVYQLPIPMYHFQSKDVKRIKTQENVDAELHNLNVLQNKWADSPFYNTVDRVAKK